MDDLQDQLENEKFEDVIGPATYFKELLRGCKIPKSYIAQITPSSLGTLASFLEAIQIDTRTAFNGVFRQSPFLKDFELNSGKLPIEIGFAEFEKRFAPMPVDIVLYFIEDMLLVRKVVTLEQPRALSFQAKVVKIRSLLGWLAKVFEGAYWQDVFIDHEREALEGTLDWLDATAHTGFLTRDGATEVQIEQKDRDMADAFWGWLETHNQMPIKFVSAMVLCGMDRDVAREKGRVDDIVSELRGKIRHENGYRFKSRSEQIDENLDRLARGSHM